MATLLKLIQGEGGTTLDLNVSTSTGFKIDEDGWIPAIATPVYMDDPTPVREVINLILSNTTYNNLATSMQSLHEMQVIAERYIKDSTQEDPVWLHAQMNGETGVRRALVRSIEVLNKPTFFGTGQSTTNIPLMIIVTREPYWESTTGRIFPDSGSKTGIGWSYDYTAAGGSVSAHDIVGDVGARIGSFTFYFASAADAIQYLWMGTRSANKHGATGLSNFVNIWECENGTNHADGTDTSDTNASGGFMVRISESSVDWDDGTFRLANYMILGQDITTNEEDQYGKYLWLLRAKPSASTTWEIYLKWSHGSGSTVPSINGPIVEINSEDQYGYFEMGIAPIPLWNIQAISSDKISTSQAYNYQAGIWARRTSGSGDLDLDGLVLIPVDEGFIKIFNERAMGSTRSGIATSPHGLIDGIDGMVSTAGTTESRPEIKNHINFILPIGDGRIYGAMMRDNESWDDDIVELNDVEDREYYERWVSLRGSE